MAIRKIRPCTELGGLPPAKAVQAVDETIQSLVEDLADTLYSTTGVGLAAPQIGVDLRVCIIHPDRTDNVRDYKVLINPQIVRESGQVVSRQEGCKSTPGFRVDVKRAEKISVIAQDLSGANVAFDADGFEAIVIQHELDHLNGILIIDRVDCEDRVRFWTYARHSLHVTDKLVHFKEAEDGVLRRIRRGTQSIILFKQEDQVQMYYGDDRMEDLSGIMSRIDLNDPFNLLGIYTQAMILCLVFVSTPKRFYMLGFGGGRIPMVLHHYLLDGTFDNTEIEEDVIPLAYRYFAIEQDDRMRLFREDGRAFLAERLDEPPYDVIFVDCFSGAGHHPYRLATQEFYETCKERLSEVGVIATNLIEEDPLFEEKFTTFTECFRYVYDFVHERAHVLFGSDSACLSEDELISKAKEVQLHYQLRFPLADRAQATTRIKRKVPRSCQILSDDSTPAAAKEAARQMDPIYRNVGRNEPCPCGSGRKFKKCHGKRGK